MWTAIKYRKHSPRKVYLGSDDSELMLYGSVDYKLRKSGTEVNNVEWAGRMVFDTSAPADKPRLSHYQVHSYHALPLHVCLILVRRSGSCDCLGRPRMRSVLNAAQDSTAVKEALAKDMAS